MVINVVSEAELPATGRSISMVALIGLMLAAIGTAVLTRHRPLRSDGTG